MSRPWASQIEIAIPLTAVAFKNSRRLMLSIYSSRVWLAQMSAFYDT
jgi:hypothetical protein